MKCCCPSESPNHKSGGDGFLQVFPVGGLNTSLHIHMHGMAFHGDGMCMDIPLLA